MEKWLMIIAICECILIGICVVQFICTTYFTCKDEKRQETRLKQNEETNKFIADWKPVLKAIQWGYNDCSARLKKLEQSIPAEQKDKLE